MLPAGIGYMAGCRLVTVLVGSRGQVGLVTPTPNGHLPALFGGPVHVLGQFLGGVCVASKMFSAVYFSNFFSKVA
jgi:hypothetical protein